MRPPTPRLRINSEDFVDNENDAATAGPPTNDLFLPSSTTNNYASSSSHSAHNYSFSQSYTENSSGVAITVDGGESNVHESFDLEDTTYQSSVTKNQSTNNTSHHSHSYHNNESTTSNLDDTLAMLVADSDPHDVSVL